MADSNRKIQIKVEQIEENSKEEARAGEGAPWKLSDPKKMWPNWRNRWLEDKKRRLLSLLSKRQHIHFACQIGHPRPLWCVANWTTLHCLTYITVDKLSKENLCNFNIRVFRKLDLLHCKDSLFPLINFYVNAWYCLQAQTECMWTKSRIATNLEGLNQWEGGYMAKYTILPALMNKSISA